MSPPEAAASQSQLTIPSAKYTCVCRDGYYIPNEIYQGMSSDAVEAELANFSCSPCPNACLNCNSDGSCNFGHEEPEDFLTESLLRAIIGATLGACVVCCLALSYVVFHQRKCKVSVDNNF